MEEDDDDQIQPLDFDAPILSVRRIFNTPRPARTGPVVPFTWEQTPGRPKPPPGPIPHEPAGEEAASDSSDGSTVVPRGSGSFRKDPETGDLMMGRFLAAARAAATGPLRDRDGDYGRRRKAQHRPNFVLKDGFGEDEELNPAAACIDHRGQDAAESEHSWEAVYTHKLGENLVLREDRNKLTSESNWLTYWSDSQSPDGSSPYYGKGSNFDSYEKSGESNLDRTPSRDDQQESGSMSPSADTTLYVNSVQLAHTRNSKSSSGDEIGETNNGVDFENARVHPECCLVLPGLLSAGEHCEVGDSSLNSEKGKEKSNTNLSLSLLSPPLPSSPSESWLHRTLPSVSSKNLAPRSLLGIQVQHRRQPSRTSLNVNYSKADSRHIRSIRRGAK